jgi:Flp pilus assembly protein TadG
MKDHNQQRVSGSSLITRTKKGIALPMMAVLAFVFLAFLGLVFDGGLLYFKKRWMQSAADAAAYGAAHEILRERQGKTKGDIVATGREDAARNGFTDGEAQTTVTINNPPTAGPNQNNGFVEAIIEQTAPTYFIRAINVDAATVSARAVAGVSDDGDICIQALDENAKPGLKVNGTATLNASCGVRVNSCNSQWGLEVDGRASITASEIGVCGGEKISGDVVCTDSSECPTVGAPPIPDMFLGREQPSDAFLAAYAPVFTDTTVKTGDTVILNPGRYNGKPGIQISGGTVTFTAGFYVIEGMDITGGTVTGIGVTFYNTGSELIKVNGGTVTFEAPVTGITPAMDQMLLWCDRSSPDKNPGHMWHGNGASSIQGILYCKTQHVDWAGNHQANEWITIVANTIKVAGTSDVTQTTVITPPPGTIPELLTISLFE